MFLLAISLLFSVNTIVDGGIHGASACQCGGRPAAESFANADVVFVGKVTGIDRDGGDGVFFSIAREVRFDVYTAWKGIDTKSVTVRTGVTGGCADVYPFGEGEEYLVYAFKTITSIETPMCAGTEPLRYAMEGDDFLLLDTLPTVPLREGNTHNNLFPIMLAGTGVGASIAVGIISIFVLRRN
jgi:hypothetical protein